MQKIYYVTLSEKQLNKKKMYNKNVYLFDSLNEIEEDFYRLIDIAEVEAISKVKIADNVEYEKELKAKHIIFIEQLDNSYDDLDVVEYKHFLAKFSSSQEIQEKILQKALKSEDYDLLSDLTLNALINSALLDKIFNIAVETSNLSHYCFDVTLIANVQHSKELFEKFFNNEELKDYSILSNHFTKNNLIDMLKYYNQSDENYYRISYDFFRDVFFNLDETILTNDILLDIIENKEETLFNKEMKQQAIDTLKNRIA